MKPETYTPSGELRRFVDRLLNGAPLSRTESARLEELIEDDAALAYFVTIMQQDELMPLALGSMSLPKARSTSWAGLTKRTMLIVAAACIVFVAGYHFGNRATSAETPVAVVEDDSPSTRITGLVGIEWEPGSEPDLIGADSQLRNLAFRSGLAEITYDNGIRVTLQGPADFSITGPNSARPDDTIRLAGAAGWRRWTIPPRGPTPSG